MTEEKTKTSKPQSKMSSIIVRFAGDSGDGMQLAGDQFTDTTAVMGNDFATLPDYPAEIRAPAGTLPGVSSFQIQFSDQIVSTPGDLADVLIAMNPAALKVNLVNTKKNGMIIVNESVFTEQSLKKANWQTNPLTDATLKDYQLLKVPLSDLTKNALKDHPLKLQEVERCKNFFSLGMMFWLYDRSLEHTINWIQSKFKRRPEIVNANVAALKAGYNYADITETMPSQYKIEKAKLEPGTYRKISGNTATAMGFVAAAHIAGKTLFYGSYPITPASSILHELAALKNFGVKTLQAEDEIAAIGTAIGASFGGHIGVTGTSGPGLCLKSEALNLAIMAELPLVVIDVQRAGPSTGMPTKTEQADLLQAMFGRNGESPIAIVAPRSPADCFRMAFEAVRIAVKFMTPVILMSEGFLAEGSEPWKLPEIEKLPKIEINHPSAGKTPFMPYARDPKTLARPWAVPGTPGLEHRIGGLAKADLTGGVSYDPANNQKMINLRAEKIRRIADDIPEAVVNGPESGKLLVLGWGGRYGSIYQAAQEIRRGGQEISFVHLNYVNPFPRNLGKIIKHFEKILVPELNMGHLLFLLRAEFPGVNAIGFNKVQGQPFQVSELVAKIKELL
ncbi:MAG: 2-oxoglutarate ferredoxin oxidoreductase subunit alpha [Candidatus Omnitrophica bacterium CG11_big_fil_rev_8_21_14_0_20_45_26]|uniref:2-oxoglutarate ferredoxin oxidoreductase subunit alpha n=1 Tax=Candidatus Abzuiibacterium crystallinum TaxID=1974748 RepID=A0A2H0LQR9_9BACT|nr:MAG: 2-oxoglutarate ferredoxin oxidoreductase subunit alpha [Candidatus Omnitrophica bacterium CG11_big_fil_rev_8_21_14_0_20_45_26]PIW65682.1 MAG: 2-oxoglutarate ferredoxin oxidoreductase subunit alpha [Candidatus Omnitrophica bacterium CG12_big_fil_rev_8_21_14_0_65_45_16]